jgi:lambda family phage portal protein
MSKPVEILDVSGTPLPPSVRAAARQRYAMSAAYQAGSLDHPALANWRPSNWSGQSSQAFGRDFISSRVHDIARNDGWGSAAVSRFVDETIGSGWRLSSKPNATTLGISQDQADDIGDQLEALWRDYADEPGFWCDAEREAPMAGVLGLGMRHRFLDGEAAAHIVWRGEATTGAPLAPTGYATCVHVIDPQRISNPSGQMDAEFLQQGVALDEWGAAIGYYVRRQHPGDNVLMRNGMFQWDYVPRDIDGRPNFILMKERKRAGERRGVADIVSVLRKHKQVTDVDDYELQAIALNAVLAAFVTSPFDLAELADDFGAGKASQALKEFTDGQGVYYNELPIRLPGAQINFLRTGEDVKFSKSEHPNANFEVFERTALRNIASAVGLTYEMLTMDWSQVNYSSARAAMLVIYRSLGARKDAFASGFMMPIYRAWLEEVFDRRLIRLPAGAASFEANPAGWCHADWIGPGRGWVDPEKEAKAAAIRMATATTTLESETAEQGGDWKANILQKSREQNFAAKHGVSIEAGTTAGVAAAGAPSGSDKEEARP